MHAVVQILLQQTLQILADQVSSTPATTVAFNRLLLVPEQAESSTVLAKLFPLKPVQPALTLANKVMLGQPLTIHVYNSTELVLAHTVSITINVCHSELHLLTPLLATLLTKVHALPV